MFTRDEINILMDALDAWETQKSGSSMVTGMIGLMIGGKEHNEKMKAEFEDSMKEAAKITKVRGEQTILLKAKLLGLRDKVLASEAGDFLSEGE